MKEYSELDSTDLAILDILQTSSNISNVELGRQVQLSPPAIHARIRRLEELGYIQGYSAQLNREHLGFDMLCFIQISLQVHKTADIDTFVQAIIALPEVLECHQVTGEFDYLLKVIVRNRRALHRFLMEKLTPMPSVTRIQTSLALTEIKSTTVLPLDQEA
ncbi:MAG: Lrp/AsnC family transcriptional regulator [Anaerolineae bacterium]